MNSELYLYGKVGKKRVRKRKVCVRERKEREGKRKEREGDLRRHGEEEGQLLGE